MVLRRIGVVSCAKMMTMLYALLGLVVGIFFSLFGLLGMAAGLAGGREGAPGAAIGAIFGIGAIIFMPIVYGLLGFIGGLLMAWLYNFVARLAGGIELELS